MKRKKKEEARMKKSTIAAVAIIKAKLRCAGFSRAGCLPQVCEIFGEEANEFGGFNGGSWLGIGC